MKLSNRTANIFLLIIYATGLVFAFDTIWIAFMTVSFFAGLVMMGRNGLFSGMLWMLPASAPLLVVLVNLKNLAFNEALFIPMPLAITLSYIFSGLCALLVLFFVVRDRKKM